MFTFKVQHPTGRYRSFDSRYDDIKIKKRIVGTITETRGFADDNKCLIRFYGY